MKKQKRFWCMMVVFALVVSMLAGCGSDDKTADGVVNLKFLTHGANISTDTPKYQEQVEAVINEKLKEELGFEVNIEVTIYPDDQFDEKLALDLSAGKTYDLVQFPGWQSVQTFALKGMLCELTEVVDTYGDNLIANIGEDIWEEVTFEDKVYAIPLPSYRITNTGWIRKDLLDKHQLNVPTTLEEFENVLKVFKEEEGMLPYATSLTMLERYLLGCFTDTPGNYVNEDGQVRPKYYLEGYKEMIAKVREWYAKGYVDDMLFNGDETESISLFGRNMAGINCGNIWQKEFGSLNAVAKANPDWDITFLEPLEDCKKVFTTALTTEALVVPITAKNPEVAIQFVNWALYNEENYNLVMYGIEGMTYVNKEDGELKWREAPEGENAGSIRELFSQVLIGYNATYNTEYLNENTDVDSAAAYKMTLNYPIDKLYVDALVNAPINLSIENNMNLNDGMQIINEYIQDIITGARPMEDYDKMLKEFEALDALKAYDEYTAAYEEPW